MSDSLQSWYQPTVRTCYKKAWSHYCSLLALSGQVHLVFPCHYTMSTPFLCFPSPASHSQGLAWRVLQFQHSTLYFCIRTSLSSCPNCSFPLVNHGHVVVVFLFLKLLIWTCCLCLHHWTQECFPIPVSGCVVSHAPALCWDGNLDMCAGWELQRVSTSWAIQMTRKWGPQDMLQSK